MHEDENEDLQDHRPHITSALDSHQLSPKQEAKLIHYADQEILNISRLYKNRAVGDGEAAVASAALDQLAAKVQSLCKVLAQVPLASASIAVAYLLTIVDMITEYIRVFNVAPDSTFTTLTLIDQLFHQLLRQGQVSITEQTRLKALIGRVRSVVYSKYNRLQDYEANCSKVFELSIGLI